MQGFAVVPLVLLFSTAVLAQETAKKVCIERHAESQKLRKAGKLGEAKDLLVQCASEECPAPIREECGKWAEEVEASLPSILIEVRGDDGALRSDVEIWIDGTRRAESLTGLPLPLDPGEHEIEIRPARQKPEKRRVLVNVGAKGQSVAFSLAKKPVSKRAGSGTALRKAAPRSEAKGTPTAAYVLGGVGLVALGVGGYFGYTAKTRADALEDCRPHCDRDEADAMRQKALVADISLGVGVVALGVATVLWLTSGPRSEVASSRYWDMHR